MNQKAKPGAMKLSLVVPIYNEQDNILPVVDSIEAALNDISYEIIFVDDGSDDATVERVLALTQPNIRLLQFARNFGQTSAMAAGIDAAVGEYIVTMDGDLQNDPSDIPMMIEKLESEDLDMVAGIRADRKDGMLLRKIPSMSANMLIRKVSKVQVKDYGCTLKLFKSELAKKLDLYGELHRFIPILADMRGAKIAEVEVQHHPRKFGRSKYGLSRTLRVASDLLLMGFFIRYRQKPMHLFGSMGLMSGLVGGLIAVYLLFEKMAGNDIGDRPLFYIGILLLIFSVQLITTGFLAELMMRTWYRVQGRQPYIVLREYQAGKEVEGE